MTEGAARLADRRGVDDRERCFEVIHHEPVEEGFVPVLEADQIDVLFQRAGLALEVSEDPFFLLLQRQDSGREQATKTERVALFLAERGALVAPGVVQKGSSLNIGDGISPRDRRVGSLFRMQPKRSARIQ